MTRADLLTFMRGEKYAIEASVSDSCHPQAAVVGIAVTDAFEIVFDTLATSRKARNLAAVPAAAFVIGATRDGAQRTVQYEGIADVPSGVERDRIREIYFARFPDGRDRLEWPGLIHIRVTPTWIRYSDYNGNPPLILELDASALHALR